MARDPYANKTDTEVLALAARALRKAAKYPPGDVRHVLSMALYDSASNELNRRLMAHVLAQLGEDG